MKGFAINPHSNANVISIVNEPVTFLHMPMS